MVKKILYVVTKSNFGGAQRYVFDMATNLPKGQFEAVVAFGGDGKLKDKLETSDIRTVQIDRLDRDISLLDEFRVFSNLLKIIRSEQPDILHLNSAKAGGLGALAGCIYNLSNSFFGLFLKAESGRRKTRIIYTVHGWTFREERPYAQNMLIRFFSWLTILFSDTTIAVSERDFINSPDLFLKHRIVIVKNGIGETEFKERESARREIFKKSGLPQKKSRLCIGTIAELHRNKGLSYAIEAMSDITNDIPNSTFFIFSDGEERKNLEEKIRSMNLGEKVFLLGFVEDAARFLPAFDIFILPSIKEGLPYTILEAGLAGKAVVATAVGGIPEIIDDMKSGILVQPRQPKEIASAIKFLAENPERAEEFGKNLSQKITKYFSLDEMLRKTVALYS
jgi:glycosyltransferase involved in cell wall biosynthesis